MRFLRTLFVSASTLLACVICSGQAAEETSKPFKGKFVSYDPDLNTLRIVKSTDIITFAVDKNVKVIVDGNANALRLSEMKESTPINMMLTADGTTVTEVRPVGPRKGGGIVDSVSLENRTLIVRKGKKKETYTFIDSVTVTEDKDESPLESVRPGLVVTFQLTFDQTKVAVINLRTPKKK